MADQQQENLATKAVTTLLRLFGPAPVLSSEDRAQFDQVLESLITCFLPKDFMEQTLVWELAHCHMGDGTNCPQQDRGRRRQIP